MSADFQYSAALKALDFIERRVIEKGRYTTYLEVAEAIGYGPKHLRAIGQVMSRIDAACFYADLPFLASVWVRKDDGTINPQSFATGMWLPHRDELAQTALDWPWTKEDFFRIRSILSSSLPHDAATRLWEQIESFGQKAIDRALRVGQAHRGVAPSGSGFELQTPSKNNPGQTSEPALNWRNTGQRGSAA